MRKQDKTNKIFSRYIPLIIQIVCLLWVTWNKILGFSSSFSYVVLLIFCCLFCVYCPTLKTHIIFPQKILVSKILENMRMTHISIRLIFKPKLKNVQISNKNTTCKQLCTEFQCSQKDLMIRWH